MLPSSPQVNEVYLGADGIFPSISRLRDHSEAGLETLAIDSTTLDVVTAKEVSRQVAHAGIRMVDAPVSGGKFTPVWFSPHFLRTVPLKQPALDVVHCE